MRGVFARAVAVAALFTPPAAAQVPTLVSQTPYGVSGNSWSVAPAMSADGSTVAFVSLASDLVQGDTNGVSDVFVRRLSPASTIRVSVASDGSQANGPSDTCGPALSADGRYVAFASSASNLVPNDTNAASDIFVHDIQTGATSRASLMPDGTQATRGCSCPSVSADGRYVAFDTALDPLTSVTRVYLHDRTLGRTTLLPVPSDASLLTRRAALSANGRFVAFMSYTRGGVPGILYDDRVLLFDRDTGITRSLARTGSASDDVDAAGTPSISADGRWVAFASSWSLAGIDTNRTFDVFLHDTTIGATRLVSTTDTGIAGGGLTPRVSADGRFVVFYSPSGTLDPTRPGVGHTIYLSDQADGRVSRVGLPGGPAREPSIGANAFLLAFVTDMPLDGPDAPDEPDVYTQALDYDSDAMLDVWEDFYGVNAWKQDDGNRDADGDGLTNAEEFAGGTHPRGLFTRLLAEGATGPFFDTGLSIGNPNTVPATAALSFQTRGGTSLRQSLWMDARRPAWIDVDSIPGLETAEFSIRIESDVPLAVDRTMTWDARSYGGHAETAVAEPSLTWHLAEGATHSGFDLFYLLQNPDTREAQVEITYLLPSPQPPLVKEYRLPATSRTTLWIDFEDARLANTDVAAVIRSTNGVPILVERAMYLNRLGRTFAAGHAGAGLTAPLLAWSLAEGATGPFFDLFVLVANPGDTDAEVAVRYLLPGGRTVERTHRVAARSRRTIWVDTEGPELADTAVSTRIDSLNSVPIVVERAMWWPGPTAATWNEAHVVAGLPSGARRWTTTVSRAFAENGDCFLLMANLSPRAATADVSLYFQDGASEAHAYTLPAQSRANAWINADFPSARGRPFVASVVSTEELVVERAEYWQAEGVPWEGGTAAAATPLVDVFEDEASFVQATGAKERASFDAYPPARYAPPFTLGDVRVGLTTAPDAWILSPGYLPVFTNNFLWTGVLDAENNVLIVLPSGTSAAGVHLARGGGETLKVTVTDGTGGGTTLPVHPAIGSGRFVGFSSAAGIRSIRISAPPPRPGALFLYVGDVVFAR